MKIEIVVAKWSGPALKSLEILKEELKRVGWNGEIVVHDHDTTEFVEGDPTFQGWGECRLDGGPWMRVPKLIRSIEYQKESIGQK